MSINDACPSINAMEGSAEKTSVATDDRAWTKSAITLKEQELRSSDQKAKSCT